MSPVAPRCEGCQADLLYRGRGRPPWCEVCKAAHYAANKAEIAAKKRDYYAAKLRADGRLCKSCGERMSEPSPSGLCGFCVVERRSVAA